MKNDYRQPMYMPEFLNKGRVVYTMYGYIYMTTNLVNGKRYIGQKKSEVFLENNYLGSGKYIGYAINSHGRENFSVSVIEWCSSKSELDEREKYWIKHYDAVNSDNFYNLQAGGQTGNIAGSRLSEETKLKLSISHKGRFTGHDNPMYGKKHSEESRIKLSNSLKGKMSGNKNPMYGKHKTDEQKKYLSDLFKGTGGPFYGKRHSDETRKIISDGRLGDKNPCYSKIWITKGENNKRVLESEFDKYYNDGWRKGRYVSDVTRQRHSESVKSKRKRDKNGRLI